MTTRARVLQLVHGFGLEAYGGGAERFAFALAQALDPEQFEVVVCALWGTGSAYEAVHAQQLAASGVEVHTLAPWDADRPAQGFRSAYGGLTRYLKAHPAQILHSHSQFGDAMLAVYRLGHGQQVIVRTPHDGHAKEWRRRPARRLLLTEMLYPLLYDAEIGVSQAIVRRLDARRLARRLRRRAHHIPNAVDLERFADVRVDVAAKRQSLGLPTDGFVVGSVGRLAVEKGYDLLLRALPRVVEQVPGAHAVVVGGGDLLAELQALAATLGLADRVHWLGPRSDVEAILPCFDLFVSSSRWEGLSTVVLESMASRVPVVATAVGGNCELITNGHDGWLVPAEDAAALAEAIVRAAREPACHADIVAHAWQKVPQFTIQEVARRHAQLYRSLLDR